MVLVDVKGRGGFDASCDDLSIISANAAWRLVRQWLSALAPPLPAVIY
jgi:hypothetical protein